MIANNLEINCSKNCELVLSLCYLLAPEKLQSVANVLSQDRDSPAHFLARAINNLPQQKAFQLSEITLNQVGIETGQSKSNFLQSLITAVVRINK